METLRRGHKAPPKTVSPQKLDIRKIFRLDVDDELFQEDPGLGNEACDNLPPWLSDEKVRNGIVSMLERDRCLEEIERLDAECLAMQSWLADEQLNLGTALSAMGEFKSHLRIIQPNSLLHAPDNAGMRYQLQRRLEEHNEINVCWRRTLSIVKPDMQWLPENRHPISVEPIVAYSRKFSRPHTAPSSPPTASSQDNNPTPSDSSDHSDSDMESVQDEVDPADDIIDNMADNDADSDESADPTTTAYIPVGDAFPWHSTHQKRASLSYADTSPPPPALDEIMPVPLPVHAAISLASISPPAPSKKNTRYAPQRM